MYLHRSIESVLVKAINQTKVVLVTGARQTGKTTVIQNTFSDYNYITLDDENMLILAKTDPPLFFKDQEYPLIIDEVQYAPMLRYPSRITITSMRITSARSVDDYDVDLTLFRHKQLMTDIRIARMRRIRAILFYSSRSLTTYFPTHPCSSTGRASGR